MRANARRDFRAAPSLWREGRDEGRGTAGTLRYFIFDFTDLFSFSFSFCLSFFSLVFVALRSSRRPLPFAFSLRLHLLSRLLHRCRLALLEFVASHILLLQLRFHIFFCFSFFSFFSVASSSTSFVFQYHHLQNHTISTRLLSRYHLMQTRIRCIRHGASHTPRSFRKPPLDLQTTLKTTTFKMPSHRRLLAAMLAAASVVLASPAPVPAPAADTTTAPLAPTDAWVSVGSDGTAKTITPLLTTISGTPTVLSAKPTVSGTASSTEQPEATATNGAGSFPVCSNVDGDLAPFCAPTNGSTLNPGITYYGKFGDFCGV